MPGSRFANQSKPCLFPALIKGRLFETQGGGGVSTGTQAPLPPQAQAWTQPLKNLGLSCIYFFLPNAHMVWEALGTSLLSTEPTIRPLPDAPEGSPVPLG